MDAVLLEHAGDEDIGGRAAGHRILAALAVIFAAACAGNIKVVAGFLICLLLEHCAVAVRVGQLPALHIALERGIANRKYAAVLLHAQCGNCDASVIRPHKAVDDGDIVPVRLGQGLVGGPPYGGDLPAVVVLGDLGGVGGVGGDDLVVRSSALATVADAAPTLEVGVAFVAHGGQRDGGADGETSAGEHFVALLHHAVFGSGFKVFGFGLILDCVFVIRLDFLREAAQALTCGICGVGVLLSRGDGAAVIVNPYLCTVFDIALGVFFVAPLIPTGGNLIVPAVHLDVVGDVLVDGAERGHIGDRRCPDGFIAAILPLPCPRIVLFPMAECLACGGVARCDFAFLGAPILGCHAEVVVIIDIVVTAVHNIVAEPCDGLPVGLGEGEGFAGVVGEPDPVGAVPLADAGIVVVHIILTLFAAVAAGIDLHRISPCFQRIILKFRGELA